MDGERPDRPAAGPPPRPLRFDCTPANRRVVAALTTVADGRIGTRGLGPLGPIDERDPPLTVASGVFDNGVVPALLPGPIWTATGFDPAVVTAETVTLDLGRGVVAAETSIDAGTAAGAPVHTEHFVTVHTEHFVSVHTEHFVSVADPGLCAVRLRGPATCLDAEGPALVAPPSDDATVHRQRPGSLTVASTRGAMVAGAAAIATDREGERTITRIVAVTTDGTDPDPGDLATRTASRLDRGVALGFDELLARHEAEWTKRWRAVSVEIAGDTALEQALHFAQYHLLSSSHAGEEAAIGARGLTGPAYRGHVFWDTDVFVLPALSAMAPDLARAALRYRVRRLDAARRRARNEGRAGARFPWESAHDGTETTPTAYRDLRGEIIPIRTGELEEHIVADVAWAFCNHLDWTGDTTWFASDARQVLAETARYWQARVERDSDGSGHIRGVIGPDEYHEDVDDNAYTNLMAAWNLRRAAELCRDGGGATADECRAWVDTADHLVTGYAPEWQVHEQHAGFFALEPLLASSLGPPPPISADAILGHERLQETQIAKQPDVLMAHHLIPAAMAPAPLDAALDYYLPRTAHGSSLSPAVVASLLARAGRTDEALTFFSMAARFDLDDLSGTTAGGLHLATMGGLWQAFTDGFLGIRVGPAGLTVEPRIPDAWATVIHRFGYRGAQVEVTADPDRFTLTATRPIPIVVDGQPLHRRSITGPSNTARSQR